MVTIIQEYQTSFPQVESPRNLKRHWLLFGDFGEANICKPIRTEMNKRKGGDAKGCTNFVYQLRCCEDVERTPDSRRARECHGKRNKLEGKTRRTLGLSMCRNPNMGFDHPWCGNFHFYILTLFPRCCVPRLSVPDGQNTARVLFLTTGKCLRIVGPNSQASFKTRRVFFGECNPTTSSLLLTRWPTDTLYQRKRLSSRVRARITGMSLRTTLTSAEAPLPSCPRCKYA